MQSIIFVSSFFQVENLKRVRPTKFLAVPRVWEKIAEKMQSAGKSSKGLKKVLGDWAKSVATEHHTLVREGKIKPNQEKMSFRIARKLILRYILTFFYNMIIYEFVIISKIS